MTIEVTKITWKAEKPGLPAAVEIPQRDIPVDLDEVFRFGLEELAEDAVREFLAAKYGEGASRFAVCLVR